MILRLRSLASAMCLVAGALTAADRTHVTVLSTTDLHGHVHPVDYYRQTPTNNGLAKVGTLIRRARALDPELVLIDCGDTLQGTPLAYHAAVVEPQRRNPIVKAMNELGFDAVSVGNHEYNFGLEVLNQARRTSRFPWISGNVLVAGSQDPAYTPYLVKEVRGVRVGVIGLVTPAIPAWEKPEHYAGLEFSDPVAAARRWVRELRQRVRADVVVIAMHMGMEEEILTGLPNPGQIEGENSAVRIAREVPGIDLILMGHTHREVPSLTINGVLLTQAGKWGEFLSRSTLFLERTEPTAPWRLIGKTATTHPVSGDVAADPAVLEITQETHHATEAWLDQIVGYADQELTTATARFEDNALIDLIHRVQLESTGADVSLTACFNDQVRVPEGDVTLREIASLYIYENTLTVVELTGAQLKAALEHSARYFGAARPGATAAELVNPAVPGYNFDIAEGVDYTIDLAREPGERILDLRFEGRALGDDQKLKVAINNYRESGGGGYTMLAEAPVLSRSNVGIRQLIVDWVLERGNIPTEATRNWSLRLP